MKEVVEKIQSRNEIHVVKRGPFRRFEVPFSNTRFPPNGGKGTLMRGSRGDRKRGREISRRFSRDRHARTSVGDDRHRSRPTHPCCLWGLGFDRCTNLHHHCRGYVFLKHARRSNGQMFTGTPDSRSRSSRLSPATARRSKCPGAFAADGTCSFAVQPLHVRRAPPSHCNFRAKP